MTDRNIYQLGEQTHTRIDRHGHEETWSWVVTPATVTALQTYYLEKARNAQ